MKYKVPEGWKEVKLGDVAEYVNDKVSIDKCKTSSYISTTNMIENKGGVIEADELPKSKTVNSFKKNDILISNIRPYFKKIWFAEFDGTSSTDILIIRCSTNFEKKFLYYALSNDKFFNYATKTARGTKMPRGDKEAILQYKLPKLHLQEQKAIADTLSAIDDKIELNNKINQNLEAQAQAIFKSWFIDFEPFQDGEFVESELGMIPKGWQIKKLQDIVIENRRGISPKYNDNDVGIPVINQKCIRNYQVIEEEIKYHDNSVLKARDVFYLKPYDILINSMGVGTLGRVAQISNPAKEMLVHSCITILRADIEIVTRTYLGYAVKSKQNIIEQMGSGSTGQTSLKKSDLENLNFIIPPIEIQKEVDGLFENILIEKDILHKQNQILSQLRDTLLPKLISGEIRIPLDK